MSKICSFVVVLGLSMMILFVGLQSVYEVGYENVEWQFNISSFVEFFDGENATNNKFWNESEEIMNFRFPKPIAFLNVLIVPFQTLLRFCGYLAKVIYYVGITIWRFLNMWV